MQENEFEFHIKIDNNRVYRGKNGELYIEGVASSTAVDSHETIFNANCQDGFAFDINSGNGTDEPVVIEVEHKGDEAPVMVIGVIERAFVDSDQKLNIVARLDDKNPLALYYFEILSNPDPKLGRPKQLGLSINGWVKEAHWEHNEELNKQIRVFDRCILKKVGIVRSPSNPETWVEKMARSFTWSQTNETVLNKEQTMETNQEVQTQATEVVSDVEETREEVSTDTEVDTEVVAVVETAPEVEAEVESVVETEVTEEVAEVEVAVEPVAETETEVQEVVEEVTVDEEVAVEEAVAEPTERVNPWAASNIIEVIEALSDAMSSLEYYVVDREWDTTPEGQQKQQMATSIVKSLSTSVPVLLNILGMELGPRPTESEGFLLSADAPVVAEEVVADAEPIVEVETEEVVEEVREVEVVADPAIEVSAIDTPVLSSLLDAVRELIAPINETLKALQTDLADSAARNKELTERLERVEKSPATSPGSQLVGDEIVRTEESEYTRQLNRARDKGDTDTMTRLILQRLHNKK